MTALPPVFTDPTVMSSFITAGFGLVSVLLGFLIPHVLRQKKETAAIREQVQNSHKTNLRDDIDRVLAGQHQVLLILGEHGTAIADLRTDVAGEQRERLALAQRIDTTNEGA